MKHLLFDIFFLLPLLCIAENCPNITNIKNNHFHAWQVLNIDSGSMVLPSNLHKFQAEVDHFALAEWMENAPEGESHCYYSNQASTKNYLNVFLAKKNLLPVNNAVWQKKNYVSQCFAGITECAFVYN